jgi:hypothetical protein
MNLNPIYEYLRFYFLGEFKDNFIPLPNYPKITLSHIFPRWLMINSAHTFAQDPVLPTDTSLNNQQFIQDIIYLYPKISDAEILIIIEYFDLQNNCKLILSKCNAFIKYFDDNYLITKSEQSYFTILTLTIHPLIKINLDLPHIHNVKIPTLLYDKLKYRLHDALIYILILRYNTLDSSNQQLANNPMLYKDLKKSFGVNFELFASGLNCSYDNFCSLYPDVEQYLGSRGSFNNYEFNDDNTFYVSNPPFDEEIVTNMALRLFDVLERNKALSIFITIPDEWTNFYGLDLLKKSKYLTYFKHIPKNKAKYFNYSTNKIIYPCSVAFILLQNKNGVKEINKKKLNNIINKYY